MRHVVHRLYGVHRQPNDYKYNNMNLVKVLNGFYLGKFCVRVLLTEWITGTEQEQGESLVEWDVMVQLL